MENNDFRIQGFTLAVTNMEKMVNFYQQLFDITFEEFSKYGTQLYQGNFGDLRMLMCPAEIAGNKAQQNRHQFDIVVDHLDLYKEKIPALGGTLMGEVVENDDSYAVGFKDPDENSMVLIQYK